MARRERDIIDTAREAYYAGMAHPRFQMTELHQRCAGLVNAANAVIERCAEEAKDEASADSIRALLIRDRRAMPPK